MAGRLYSQSRIFCIIHIWQFSDIQMTDQTRFELGKQAKFR